MDSACVLATEVALYAEMPAEFCKRETRAPLIGRREFKAFQH